MRLRRKPLHRRWEVLEWLLRGMLALQAGAVEVIYSCYVCRERRARHAASLCDPCARSYDRNAFKDGSVYGAISWAAERARRFERRRHRRFCPLYDGRS